jgi:outer membrane immunogenic protein
MRKREMTKLLWGASALILMSAGTASAADLAARYTKAPAYVPAAVYNWTGFYIGLNAGYGFSQDENVRSVGQAAPNIANILGGARPGSVDVNNDGFIGGGQIGYNWQYGGNWVAGLEADIAYTDFRKTESVTTIALNGVDRLNNNFDNKLEYLGTVRGRVGYAFDRTLVYATGGLAYGEVKNGADFFGAAGQLQFTGHNSETKTGFTAGAGIEHAFAVNWTAKAEYLYYDLGRETVNVAVVPGSGGAGTGYNTSFKNDGHIIRAGLNYKFSGPLLSGF